MKSIIGAIIGDIVGSTYEFNNTSDYNFELFPRGSSFTDDTICTVAVADAILRGIPYRDSLIEWCRKYPNPKGAYGASFSRWIMSANPQPYGSYGNGAAMRVSPVGLAFKTREEVLAEARKSAECSHSHPEGILGAQVSALAVHRLAQGGSDARKDVETICVKAYGADYAARIPKRGVWDETCQGCVPLAVHLFLQSSGFEDAVRLAVSYGGDSDTLGAIVGGMAGAFYDIPEAIAAKAHGFLPDDMLDVIEKFNKKYL